MAGLTLLPPPTIAPMADSVRELTPDEIQSYVRPKYEATNNPLPNPNISTFIGIIRDGKIVGAIGLQLKLHAQPLMIEPGYSSAFSSLVQGVEKHILEKAGPQWVYLFAPAGRLSQLAVHAGMRLEPWCVLSKLVEPSEPEAPHIYTMPDLSNSPTGDYAI